MARLTANDGRLVVRLNPLEKVMAFRGRVRVPLDAVEAVEVQSRPLGKSPSLDVTMGFAASTAPAARLATIGPRAKFAGGRALLIVWRNGRSVVVRLAANPSNYRLLVISSRHADADAQMIRRAAPHA